jgi:hypothetical protein
MRRRYQGNPWFKRGALFRQNPRPTNTMPIRPATMRTPVELAPLYGSDRYSGRPPGAFTSRLSTGRSPFPLLDITTTATGPPLLAGLSPARMTASFAAHIRSPSPENQGYHIFLPPLTMRVRPIPCAFVLVMGFGGMLGTNDAPLPYVDVAIAAWRRRLRQKATLSYKRADGCRSECASGTSTNDLPTVRRGGFERRRQTVANRIARLCQTF